MSDYLPAVIVEPEQTANAAIIWLHGLGADGHDFEPIVPQLRLPEGSAVRFIFPHAPTIPVTLNQGYVMPAWFDISALEDGSRNFNISQLLSSVMAVHKLIDREIEQGIDSRRIVLAGFSQGGAVNYQAGLSYDKPLAGMMALSSFFPTAEALSPHPANLHLPILVCHGTQDAVLNISLAEKSLLMLKELGYKPHFHIYPMPHSVCAEEIADISDWLGEIL
jgi:phospholipase/carboxylesterase